MAELADAPDLGSGGFTVGVQVPSPAPTPKGRLMDSSVTDSFCYCYKGQIAVRRRLPLFGRDSRLQNRPPEGFAVETSPAPKRNDNFARRLSFLFGSLLFSIFVFLLSLKLSFPDKR